MVEREIKEVMYRELRVCIFSGIMITFQKDKRALERNFARMKLSLEELKRKLVGFFGRREEVLLAYLFGSSLQEKFGKDHDIDIGLFLSPRLYGSLDEGRPYGYKAELTAELMSLLKYDLIDLVILNKCTPVLAYQVIHHGTLLFARSEKTRIEFELVSLKRHADTKHLRNIKRFYSEKRVEKGLSAYD